MGVPILGFRVWDTSFSVLQILAIKLGRAFGVFELWACCQCLFVKGCFPINSLFLVGIRYEFSSKSSL